MANSIAYTKNYTAVLDEVYKRAACSTCLNSPRRMARAGRNAKEIMIPKIEVTGLGDYTRNVGYKTGSITYEFETKTFNYDRGIKILADVMNLEGTAARQSPSNALIRSRPTRPLDNPASVSTSCGNTCSRSRQSPSRPCSLRRRCPNTILCESCSEGIPRRVFACKWL